MLSSLVEKWILILAGSASEYHHIGLYMSKAVSVAEKGLYNKLDEMTQ